MTAELWIVLLKTGGTAAAIVIPIVWLFRRGGWISLKVHFGDPSHGGSAGGGNGGAES